MGTVVSLRERRRLAVTNRCLARADQSILRQLHLVSELHRQRANLDFAASILKNMLVARHLILKRAAQIERMEASGASAWNVVRGMAARRPAAAWQPKLSN
jgi:hypothetical protein